MDQLTKIGRLMPYKVPEGYFDNMASGIIESNANIAYGFAPLRRIALAVASVAVVLIASYMAFDKNRVSSSDVDDAFMAMSETDRYYILDLYQNELYLFE